MSVEVRIPSVGESITEVVIAQWLKDEGEYVQKDEPILEIETDKVNQELPAPESGILKHKAKPDDTLEVGDLAGYIEEGDAPKEKDESSSDKQVKEKEASEEKGEEKSKEEPKDKKEESTSSEIKATSVAQRIASDRGIDLHKVKGTGPGGRISREDVEAYIDDAEKKADDDKPAKASPKPSVAQGEKPTRREKMSTLRKRVAARLVEAQQTAAMLTTFNEVDMTRVMALRSQFKETFKEQHGVGLGFMSFFVKASVEALKKYPGVNAAIDGDDIVYHDYYDIGVAVGTERGLVVPVLRNTENMSFAGIEETIRDYAQRAGAGKLGLDELTGGTFTISNGGVYGSMMSTPILNPPQSGILGMHNIVKRPVAIGDEVKIRPMMYVALSYDHRIIDGKEAVSFLVRLKECIENPERLLLEV